MAAGYGIDSFGIGKSSSIETIIQLPDGNQRKFLGDAWIGLVASYNLLNSIHGFPNDFYMAFSGHDFNAAVSLQQRHKTEQKSKVVRVRRLELPRLAALEPKSSASTNSATPASV